LRDAVRRTNSWTQHRDQRGTFACLAVFFAARILYWVTGGGFSTVMLGASYQLLDVRELRAHPFQSAALVHIQPPLFNLFVGSVLRWSPVPRALTFQLVYLAVGVVIIVALRSLLLGLGFAPIAATIGVCVVAASPLMISYENTVTYEYPTAMLLIVSAVACLHYVRTRRVGALAWFVVLLTVTVLIRALLHPLWLVMCVALVVWLARPKAEWPRVVAVLAVPLLLVGGVMLKNEILFGDATLSSWFGMNLGRGVISPMPRHDIETLIAQGHLSKAATIAPLSSYSSYAPQFGPCHSSFSEPVLRAEVTTTGHTNFNAQCFLSVYADAQRNALRAVLARPGVYLADRAGPFAQHFSLPPIESQAPGMDHFGHNAILRNLATAYQDAMLRVSMTVHLPDATNPLFGATNYSVSISLVLLLATALVAFRGAVGLVLILRKRRGPAEVAWLFVGFTVVYVTVVSIATEYGENQRFRAMVDPLLLSVLCAQVVAFALRWLQARRRVPTPDRRFEPTPAERGLFDRR
jgi:hypothetical protein